MTMNLQSLASINNDGARCIINNNDYDGAISCFHQTLKLTKKRLHEERLVMSAAPVSEAAGYCHEVTSKREKNEKSCRTMQLSFLDVNEDWAVCPPSSSGDIDMVSSAPSCFSSSNSIFIFRKLIIANVNACGECCNDACSAAANTTAGALLSQLMQLAFLSVYNLAVAHHLCGLQTQDKQLLIRARAYYELSYQLLQEQQQQQSSQDVEEGQEQEEGQQLLHCLSIMNNIGAICMVLNEKEMSDEVFRKLLSALTYLRENNNGSLVEGEQQSYWMSGFWNNAASSILNKPTTAKAA